MKVQMLRLKKVLIGIIFFLLCTKNPIECGHISDTWKSIFRAVFHGDGGPFSTLWSLKRVNKICYQSINQFFDMIKADLIKIISSTNGLQQTIRDHYFVKALQILDQSIKFDVSWTYFKGFSYATFSFENREVFLDLLNCIRIMAGKLKLDCKGFAKLAGCKTYLSYLSIVNANPKLLLFT